MHRRLEHMAYTWERLRTRTFEDWRYFEARVRTRIEVQQTYESSSQSYQGMLSRRPASGYQGLLRKGWNWNATFKRSMHPGIQIVARLEHGSGRRRLRSERFFSMQLALEQASKLHGA